MKVDMFVPSIIEGYYNYLIYKNKSIKNTEKYINIIRKFHNYIGKSYIDVDDKDIQSYFNYLGEFENLKCNTISRHYTVIKQFYKYLMVRGLIYDTPCKSKHINAYKL